MPSKSLIERTEKRKYRKYGTWIPALFNMADILMVNLLYWLTIAMGSQYGEDICRGWVLCNVACLLPLAVQFVKHDNYRTILLDHTVVRAFRAVGLHCLAFLSLQEIFGHNLGVASYGLLYGVMIVAWPAGWTLSRFMIKHMRSQGRNFVRVVIVGTNTTAHRLYHEMNSDAGYGLCIMGFIDDDKPEGELPAPYIGSLDVLDAYVKEHNVDEIYFAWSGEKAQALSRVLKIADDNVVSFYYVPQISRYVRRHFESRSIGAMNVLSLLRNPLSNPLNRGIKRLFDIVFSSVFLVFFPLILIPVAIAIKLSSPGPVFFKQKRTGYRGRTFNCLKFRTMRVNAAADTAQATKDDPRKTKVGDFLRKTSLDELPQFINVFLGDMSVVGPRPHMLKQTESYTQLIDKYMVRHVVKPGITGWAQVNGYRGLTDEVWKMEKRVEYDVWYIEHWHFFLDMKIIARTVLNAVHGESNAF